MKKLITFVIPLFTVVLAHAQDTADYYVASRPSFLSKDRVSASFSAGTGIAVFNGSTALTTFVAPRLNYALTEKFRLNIGFMHYTAGPNSFYSLNRNEALINTGNRSISGNLVSIGGDYMLNKKLRLSGAAMVDVSSFNSKKQDQFKAVSVGLDYKMSNNSYIRFETTISNGQGAYRNDPFGNSCLPGDAFGNGSSFGMSPAFR